MENALIREYKKRTFKVSTARMVTTRTTSGPTKARLDTLSTTDGPLSEEDYGWCLRVRAEISSVILGVEAPARQGAKSASSSA